MICPKCHKPAPEGVVFCPACGVSLAGAATAPPGPPCCPGCQREITNGTLFCPFCGTLRKTDMEAKVTDANGNLRIITFPMSLTVQNLCDALPAKLGFPLVGDDQNPVRYRLFVEGRPEPLEESLTWASCQGRLPAEPVLRLAATGRLDG